MEKEILIVIAGGIVGSMEALRSAHGNDLDRIDHGVKGQFSIPGAVVRYTFERVPDASDDCEGVEVRVCIKGTQPQIKSV